MDLKKRIVTWFVEELVRSKRMENRGTFSMNGKEGKVVGTLVGTAWFLPVAFTPFSTACFSPLHPLFGTVCPFLWPASKLYPPPSLPSSRSMKLVNRFFEGVHVIVVVRSPANVFRRRKKKTRKKKKEIGSLNFLKHIITKSRNIRCEVFDSLFF